MGAGACIGRVVSVEVWLVPKDLGATEQSRWREGERAEVRGSILGQVQECPVGRLPVHARTHIIHTIVHTHTHTLLLLLTYSLSCFLDNSTFTVCLLKKHVELLLHCN